MGKAVSHRSLLRAPRVCIPSYPALSLTMVLLNTQKLVATSDANEAYTTFTGVTRLKQGITPQGVFIPDDNEKPPEPPTQLSRSVTVPTPSTSSDPDRSFWNVILRLEPDNVDQINPVPLQRSKTTINVSARRNQNSGSETPPQSQPPSAGIDKNGSNAGRNPTTQRDLGSPMRALSVRVTDRPGVTPASKSAPPSTSLDQSHHRRSLPGR